MCHLPIPTMRMMTGSTNRGMRILRMTYTVGDKKFKLTLDIHGELFKMGDMSKSNNTGMKNIDPATSVGYSHTTNHLGERSCFWTTWIVMSRVTGLPSSKLTFLFGCWKSNEKLLSINTTQEVSANCLTDTYGLED